VASLLTFTEVIRMNQYQMSSIKLLLSETLLENPDSYVFQQLFARVTSVQELLELTHEEITECGVRPAKAKRIKSALQLGKLLAAPSVTTRTIIRKPEDAYEVLKPHLLYQPNERFVVIGLGTKNNVVFSEVVSAGTANSCLVTPLLVLRPLIKRNCVSAVLGHQHPSGLPDPSPEDKTVTKTIVDAALTCSIDILDHLILGDNCFISMKEKGLM
jgi:DNA repair protein RadC